MWQRIAGPFKEFGAGAGLLYVLGRLLGAMSPQAALYAYEFMAQPIKAAPLLPERHIRNLSFREIDRSDPAIDRMAARADIKVARFEQGARCLGVYRRDALIGYVWMCFDSYEEDEVRCTYRLPDPAHSAFDFDLYILPEHRMGTAFLAVWHGLNQYLHERGIMQTYSRMTRFNLPSRRAHARLGSVCIGRAVFLQIGTLELMVATLSPYLGLTWQTGQRTALHLSATGRPIES